MLQRFPYPPYTHDDMLEALKRNVPLLMMVSFVYTCINTVKVITVEKERQLKASNPLGYYFESLESLYKIN
jgi:ATP-binding cassette subfamily A (ABC1) protein 3